MNGDKAIIFKVLKFYLCRIGIQLTYIAQMSGPNLHAYEIMENITGFWEQPVWGGKQWIQKVFTLNFFHI